MPNGVRCENCEFCSSSQVLNHLEGDGPLNSEILFIGQHPGRQEEQALHVFAGETGKLFDELLAWTGYVRAQVRITNAIRCLPIEGQNPVNRHIKACRPWLIQEILQIRPKMIVVMGAVALESLLDIGGISELRGRYFKIREFGKELDWLPADYNPTVFCMYMPAMLFRRWEDYPVVQSDFQKLGQVLRGEFFEGGLGDYKVLSTVGEVQQIFDYLMTQPRVAFDLETTTFDFWDFNYGNDKGNILCASFSAYPGTGFVIPFMRQHAKPFWKPEEWEEVKAVLQKFFESNTPKWAQNGMFDINFLRANKFNFNMKSFTFDTMLAHHTLQENTLHDLDFLCGLYTNMPLYSFELKKWQAINGSISSYAEFPDELLWPYAGADADATVRIGDILVDQAMTPASPCHHSALPQSMED